MKKPSVRVTRSSAGGFSLWHWNKYLGWRADEAAAQAEAKERSDKLASAHFLKQMERKERHRPEPPPVKPEDLHTWRETGLDPTQPTRGWITLHRDDGHCKSRWMMIPPGHPFHWTHRYRNEQRILNGLVKELQPPGFVGELIVPPSLPNIPYEELQPCPTTESATPAGTSPRARASLASPSGGDERVTVPAAVSDEPIPMSDLWDSL